jgi:predicted nuclease with TOPRIM domain
MQRDKIVDEINRLYALGLNSNDSHLKELLEELEKENAQLKEKIRLMNEQEAKDIRSRFPC